MCTCQYYNRKHHTTKPTRQLQRLLPLRAPIQYSVAPTLQLTWPGVYVLSHRLMCLCTALACTRSSTTTDSSVLVDRIARQTWSALKVKPIMLTSLDSAPRQVLTWSAHRARDSLSTMA